MTGLGTGCSVSTCNLYCSEIAPGAKTRSNKGYKRKLQKESLICMSARV